MSKFYSARIWSTFLTLVVLFIALLVWQGWVFDIEQLKRPIAGLVAMNPFTVLLFGITALSIFGLSRASQFNKKYWFTLSLITIAIALYHLIDLVIQLPYSVDQLLFEQKLHSDFGGTRNNQTAPNTALSFVIIHASLILLNQRKTSFVLAGQFFALFISFLSIFAILGYLFRAPEYFGVLYYLPMAVHTAICFFLLSLALMLLQPHKGIMKEFTSPFSGSVSARILLPAAIIVPSIFAYFHIWLHWNKVFSTELDLTIALICFIFVFVLLIYFNTRSLNRQDQEKRIIAHKLKLANHELSVTQEETTSLNHKLTEALQNEKELVAMKNKFIAIASHEFKTPLASIAITSGFLRKYKARLTPAEIDEKLNDIDNQMEHMNYLLDEVLTVGKTESGKVQINTSQVDIHSFFSQLVAELTPEENATHHILLTVDGEKGIITYDARMLRVITVNLLTNAIKFSPGASEVKLGIGVRQNKLTITVADKGLGISKEDKLMLFRSFYRSSNVRNIPGTGLGLSIVKKTVDLLHGEIDVESKLNIGTTFTITLPFNE